MNDSTSNSRTITITLSWAALADRALVRCSNCGHISTYSEFAKSCGCYSDNYPIEVEDSAAFIESATSTDALSPEAVGQ
jgi:ribosomal protein L32